MAPLIVSIRRPRILHRLAAMFSGILIVGASAAQAHHTFLVDGDTIGANSATTNNAGGYTAVKQSAVNLGHPAILVGLNGDELLTEFRVIVFGVANEMGNLRFDRFDYHL